MSAPINRLTFELSGCYSGNGGFEERVRMETDLGWKIPDNILYEQAATVSDCWRRVFRGDYVYDPSQTTQHDRMAG